ncbi:HAMP domain-containing sensor histidine kinase [Aquabacterium sp.]|uniref:sensor histidine kinase n=1 Tax=Aquabacterium sp. TaxID=1872578 RepID=UPI002488CDE1|nr:HAMP domain-containing sensor histidine kinase [Aquabacterium sp.]MDI1259975.1 HAMP domain-containing sensor histidine kinase [Aquabacterium sp.]
MSLREPELAALAAHLRARREAILHAWRHAVKRDPALTTANSLPRAQLDDHIPALLTTFEERLDPALKGQTPEMLPGATSTATAHGLHRWQQGYDLVEVSRELGRLNECLVAELEDYSRQHLGLGPEVMPTARRIWAELSGLEFSESIAEYFRLQQLEAAGHINDLEQALKGIRELEQQRAELWHEAAHDLRGNLGVVVTATAGITRFKMADLPPNRFLQVLDRNVRALQHLLDDVTDLARLQAGKERLQLSEVDVAAQLGELADGLRALAEQRGLTLAFGGPSPFVVSGDRVKIRRIAQNLVLNAIKYTQHGGVTVTWDDGAVGDAKRWVLSVQDTGPGFDAGPGSPLIAALEAGTELVQQVEAETLANGAPPSPAPASTPADRAQAHQEPGEGIGLSIVKRLAEMLDASVEVESTAGTGTMFRVLFPKDYSG